jgi:hypothetical protein
MLRRRRPSHDPPDDPLAHVDPAATSPRYARAVADALDTRRRFGDVVAGAAPGPVRDRLADASARFDAGVGAVWEIAQRATAIERTLAALDPDRVTADYKQARRSGASPELEEALAQRFASVQRLLNTLDDTDERLRLLDARLGAAVASAAEVALGAAGGADTTRLDGELEAVTQELDALRTALDELG